MRWARFSKQGPGAVAPGGVWGVPTGSFSLPPKVAKRTCYQHSSIATIAQWEL
ncbi:MAG TPA: hypothetical protein VHZ51_18920 [Ktedonobacteraceae bacterium]|nr:hypothetical protein [Ktedonobacteraceae bacterium]